MVVLIAEHLGSNVDDLAKEINIRSHGYWWIKRGLRVDEVIDHCAIFTGQYQCFEIFHCCLGESEVISPIKCVVLFWNNKGRN